MNIIYTNPATDPYTGGDVFAMLGEIKRTSMRRSDPQTMTSDMSLVVLGGGGVAYLGVPCTSGWKARGASRSGNPTGNGYLLLSLMKPDINLMHIIRLMEQQAIADLTGTDSRHGNLGVVQQSMSYAGICGAENLAGGKLPYYHVGSYDDSQ